MTNRQPKGTPVGGQFSEGRKPDGSDLVDDRDIAMRDYMNSQMGKQLPARDYSREAIDAHKDAILDAEQNVESTIGSYAPDALFNSTTRELHDNMQTIVDNQKEIIYELESQLRAIREQPSPRVYISPDGNWGGAEGLLLLSDADVEKVGDLSELYEEYGDNMIDGVRERLEPKPELVLSYNDWHDVAEAVGNLTDAWNTTQNFSPEMDTAMSRLYFSYDTPHDMVVKSIVDIQNAWRDVDWGDDPDAVKIDKLVDSLGEFLTTKEPS